jgi:lantibiotic modifying enzyme
VDSETLVQPDMAIAGHTLNHSVLQSGMLPSWELENGGETVNAGGLAHDGQGTATKPRWQYTNTDYMYFGDRQPAALPNANIPSVDGTLQPASDFADDLIRGFEETEGRSP